MTNPSGESTEMYSVAQIRAAFKAHAYPDDWGVACFHEEGLLWSLRGEYDKPKVDKLAAVIREVDGAHDMGAAALAEALIARGVKLSS